MQQANRLQAPLSATLTGSSQQVWELRTGQLQRRIKRVGAAVQRNQRCRQHCGP